MEFSIGDPRLINPYDRIIDGGKNLRLSDTNEPLSRIIPPLRLDDIRFKLPFPDVLLQEAVFSGLVSAAADYLSAREGISLFAELYSQNKRNGFLRALSPDKDPGLMRVHLENVPLVGEEYAVRVGEFGHNIYCEPIYKREWPSLMIGSSWIQDESTGELFYFPELAVYRETGLSREFSAGTKTTFEPLKLEQVETIRHLSMPTGFADFSDPVLNNTKSVVVEYHRPTSGHSWLQLHCVGYDGMTIPMSMYSVVANKSRHIELVNKAFNLPYGNNMRDFYPNMEAYTVANNLLFLLGRAITKKNLVDVTEIPLPHP